MNIFYKLRIITKKFFAEIIFDDLSRGKIDIKSLPHKMQRFVFCSLSLLCIALFGTVILYFYNSFLPAITFSFFNVTYSISYPALALSIIAFILGWSYLLIGGIWSNTTTYTVISYLFFYFIGYFGIGGDKTYWTLLPLGFVFLFSIFSLSYSKRILKNKETILCGLALCFIISYFAIRGTVFCIKIQSVYLPFVIAGLTLFLFGFLWVSSSFVKCGPEKFISIGRLVIIFIILILFSAIMKQKFGVEDFVERLFVVFSKISAYINLFWFVLGFCALWMAINLAEWGRDTLEILFSKKTNLTLLLSFWVIVIIVSFYAEIQTLLAHHLHIVLPSFLMPYAWQASFKWTSLAALFCAFLLFKKPSEAKILGLFQLTVFVLLFSQTYYSSQSQIAGETEFGFLSLVIFIVSITWLLFQGNAIILNSTGLWFPRNARLFLFFGIIFVMVGMNNVMLVCRFTKFINEFNLTAYKGFLYIGPPFIMYRWLVRRLKRHPVKPHELVTLFISGAILVHFSIALQRGFETLKVPVYLLIFIMAVIQECIKFYTMKKLIYNSSYFNETIDGIIYSSSITLGWAVFYLNPQFALLPYPFNIPPSWEITYPQNILLIASFIWFYFTTQFVCAGFLGYGLAKAKLSKPPLTLPLVLGLLSAVLYRTISDILFKYNLNNLFSVGTIWICTGLSLLAVGITVAKSQGIFKRYLKSLIIFGLSLILCAGLLLYKKKTITYKENAPYFQFVVPRNWNKLKSTTEKEVIILESTNKKMPLVLTVGVEDVPINFSFIEYTKRAEEILELSGIKECEMKGCLKNFYNIDMAYYFFQSSVVLPDGKRVALNNIYFIFLYNNKGYAVCFFSPFNIDLLKISPIIQSFHFIDISPHQF